MPEKFTKISVEVAEQEAKRFLQNLYPLASGTFKSAMSGVFGATVDIGTPRNTPELLVTIPYEDGSSLVFIASKRGGGDLRQLGVDFRVERLTGGSRNLWLEGMDVPGGSCRIVNHINPCAR